MRTRSDLSIIVAMVGVFCFAREASACDYTSVRDAAFREPRDVHWLCVVARADDPRGKRIHDRLADWLRAHGDGLNLELELIDADDPDLNWEKDFGFPAAPGPQTPLPATVLIGRRTLERQGFVITAWEPEPTPAELDTLRSSPVRDALRDQVHRHIAVILHAPAGGRHTASQTSKTLEQVVNQWSDREKVGVSVLMLDRTDGREWLLTSFADIKPDGPPWVAVVFGRGKFMPPLTGENIHPAALNEHLEMVMADCTCSQPPRSLGVDVPLVWNDTLDENIIWLFDGPPDTQPAVSEEIVAETIKKADQGKPMVSATLWTLGGLALVVFLAAAAMMLRRTRT